MPLALRCPLRQQVEGYANLIRVLLSHWLLVRTAWPDETVGALDALRILRTQVPLLARLVFTRLVYASRPIPPPRFCRRSAAV